MRHAEAEDEPAARDRVQHEGPLCHLHRMLVLDRQHRRPDLDPVDLAQRHGQRCHQVAVEWHLSHPDPSKSFVTDLRQSATVESIGDPPTALTRLRPRSHAIHRSTP